MPPAVLFIVFNRPGPTAQVFSAIKDARPEKLYIAADGPRRHCREDIDACYEVREIVSRVDWPCEVRTAFNSDNLGCVRAVTEAVTWFFRNESEGIILEDDCLPHPDFFGYCGELLERYRFNEKVMVISGDNSIEATIPFPFSYAFTRFALIWGWASWARAWKHYDFTALRSDARNTVIQSICQNKRNFQIISEAVEKISLSQIDTWDYVWNYNIWAQQGLCVIPKRNLISNIGFGENATHTFDITDGRANRPTCGLKFPLMHPDMDSNIQVDNEILEKIFASRT